MKNTNKILFLLLIGAMFLSACTDKPNEPAKPSEQKSDVVAPPKDNAATNTKEPDADQTKADEVKTSESATSDETDKGVAETNQPANADKAESSSTSSAPVQALSLAEGKARYEKTCKICHEQGLLDAPKLTDKAGWAKRLEKDMNTLYTHSAKGFNKMPAQVTADVSEAEVYAAVDYMVSQVK